MTPESTSVTYRPDLAAQVNEYDQNKAAAKFIGRRVAPIFNSPVCSGQYPIFRRAAFKKLADLKRAATGAYNRMQGFFGQGTFGCDESGLEYPIDDATRRKYATMFDAETAGSNILWYQQLLGHEYRVAQLLLNAGATDHNVTTDWATAASAVPLTDIQTGVETLCDKCGCLPGDISLVVPRTQFKEILATTQVSNKSQYTYPGVIPSQLAPAMVAAMLGIKEVLVAWSCYDATEEGYAESNTQCWTTDTAFLIVTCDEGDPLEMPSATRTIVWTEDSPDFPTMETYRDESVRGDVVRSRIQTDEIILLDDVDMMIYQMTMA